MGEQVPAGDGVAESRSASKSAWNLATSRLRRLVVADRAANRHRSPVRDPGVRAGAGRIGAGVVRLPERQRQAIVLRHLGDLPVADVAAQLGAPKGTVLSWLSRGRAQFATDFSEREDAEGAGHHGR